MADSVADSLSLSRLLAEGLRRAVTTAGSQSALARLIGKNQSTVWDWLQLGKPLPAEHVLKVEAELGIPRSTLRPDLYPNEVASPDVRNLPLTGAVGSCDRPARLQLGEAVR